jgi:hypothetical protein
MDESCSAHWSDEKWVQFRSENLNERDHLGGDDSR